jgi:hypothetical protein
MLTARVLQTFDKTQAITSYENVVYKPSKNRDDDDLFVSASVCTHTYALQCADCVPAKCESFPCAYRVG